MQSGKTETQYHLFINVFVYTVLTPFLIFLRQKKLPPATTLELGNRSFVKRKSSSMRPKRFTQEFLFVLSRKISSEGSKSRKISFLLQSAKLPMDAIEGDFQANIVRPHPPRQPHFSFFILQIIQLTTGQTRFSFHINCDSSTMFAGSFVLEIDYKQKATHTILLQLLQLGSTTTRPTFAFSVAVADENEQRTELLPFLEKVPG